MRINGYVHHMMRSSASALELVSDAPAKFQFSTGERLSTNPVSHKELMFLVSEVASHAELDELRTKGRLSVDYDADGVSINVSVEITRPDRWTIRLKPMGVSAAAVSERESRLEAPIPHAPAVRPSISPPNVERRPGESRIDVLLREMVRLGASDLHLSTGIEPAVRLHGSMTTLEKHPALGSEELQALLGEIVPRKNREEFERDWDTDFAYAIEGVARFRANYFVDRNGPGAVFRQIPFAIVPADKLGLPPKVLDLC